MYFFLIFASCEPLSYSIKNLAGYIVQFCDRFISFTPGGH